MIIPKDPSIKSNPKGLFNADYSGVKNSPYKHHEGIDYSCVVGTKIISIKKAIVISAINGITGYGRFVVLQDYEDNRIFYLAAHLSKISDNVKKFKIIEPNETIGYSGNSGGKTGVLPAHLHTGVYIVESKNIWDNENTGFYYGKNYYINQKFAVDPLDHSIKWKGA